MRPRFHSPYRFWVKGFLFEIAVFIVFILTVVAVAVSAAFLLG